MTDTRLLPAGTGRMLAAAQVAAGVATIASASRMVDRSWLGLSPVAYARIIRVLGARQVVQGVVTAVRNDPETLFVGAAVDLLHALSMVPFAVARGPYRRHAAVSAAAATAAALLGGAAAEQ